MFSSGSCVYTLISAVSACYSHSYNLNTHTHTHTHTQTYPHTLTLAVMPIWQPVSPQLEQPPPPEFHPPLRPSFGRIGRPIVLRANHFQVKIPNCVLYHYDVSIVPDKCPRRVNREIVEALVQAQAEYFAHQKPVFDGRKNLYSRKPLPIGRDRVRLWQCTLPLASLPGHLLLRFLDHIRACFSRWFKGHVCGQESGAGEGLGTRLPFPCVLRNVFQLPTTIALEIAWLVPRQTQLVAHGLQQT